MNNNIGSGSFTIKDLENANKKINWNRFNNKKPEQKLESLKKYDIYTLFPEALLNNPKNHLALATILFKWLDNRKDLVDQLRSNSNSGLLYVYYFLNSDNKEIQALYHKLEEVTPSANNHNEPEEKQQQTKEPLSEKANIAIGLLGVRQLLYTFAINASNKNATNNININKLHQAINNILPNGMTFSDLIADSDARRILMTSSATFSHLITYIETQQNQHNGPGFFGNNSPQAQKSPMLLTQANVSKSLREKILNGNQLQQARKEILWQLKAGDHPDKGGDEEIAKALIKLKDILSNHQLLAKLIGEYQQRDSDKCSPKPH